MLAGIIGIIPSVIPDLPSLLYPIYFLIGKKSGVVLRSSFRLLNNMRSSHRRCSVEKVFLEISQDSQENTCARVSFLIKLQPCLRYATLLNKRLWHRCFLVNFAKFLRTPFYTEHLWWLLL